MPEKLHTLLIRSKSFLSHQILIKMSLQIKEIRLQSLATMNSTHGFRFH